uniref:Uncharacterized protein n=1 Tax=Arion vulgaris TaxID=1028688 RepID=A0A0B7BI52_9EUPU
MHRMGKFKFTTTKVYTQPLATILKLEVNGQNDTCILDNGIKFCLVEAIFTITNYIVACMYK